MFKEISKSTGLPRPCIGENGKIYLLLLIHHSYLWAFITLNMINWPLNVRNGQVVIIILVDCLGNESLRKRHKPG